MGFCSHGFSAYLFDRMFDVIDCDDDGIVLYGTSIYIDKAKGLFELYEYIDSWERE